ncbi:hypothetical protein G7054_g14334 [Neopestalotiopsis clavispora]|nr:hypothetical protein G7054_g14334 [Neopestalotiopsis clavispora]
MDSPRMINVRPAKLLVVTNTPNEKKEVAKQGCTVEVQFETDLDHEKVERSQFEDLTIRLTACFIFGGMAQDKIKTGDDLRREIDQVNRITVFLCGGPGDQNEPHRNLDFNKEYLKDNGCLIFLNYRGTGSFSEIRQKIKSSNESKENDLTKVQQRYVDLVKSTREERQSAYANKSLSDQEANDMMKLLTLFRQDSIVCDLESIRQCIGKDKWHIFGQSYGGWISLTYLSLFPESLESSTITAGLAPITVSCDDAYRELFDVVKSRNERYYGEFPGDIKRVKKIVQALLNHSQGIKIDDGHLTARRFLCIGRALGARERFPALHKLIEEMYKGVTTSSGSGPGSGPKIKISPATEEMFLKQDSWGFDRRPLYAVLHEAMYCRNQASNWSAQRVASEFPEFKWAVNDPKASSDLLRDLSKEENEEKIYFSGEMVYQFMFEDYDALKPLKAVAEKLAQHEWTDPYNFKTLQDNKVSVTALTAALIARIRHQVLEIVPGTEDEFQHASLRTDTAAVFKALNTLESDSK